MKSATPRGTMFISRNMPPIDLGTYTSTRPVWSASTIPLATSSGSITLIPRVRCRPEPSSVLTTTGITMLTSMPVLRTSARIASLRPTTACLVAQ